MGQHVQRLSGYPVVDAKRPINLMISPGDIRHAKIKDPHNCVAANACRSHLKIYDVRVHLTRIFLMFKKGIWTKYEVPKSLRTEVVVFDRGGKFEPSAHQLKVPPAYKPRLGKPTKKPGTNKSLAAKRHKTINVRASA